MPLRTAYDDASTALPFPLSPASSPSFAPSVASGFSTNTPLALGSLSFSAAAAVESGTLYPAVEVAGADDPPAVLAAADEFLSCHAGRPGGLMLKGREEPPVEEEVELARPGVVAGEPGDGVGAAGAVGRRAMRRDLSDLSSVWRSLREDVWAEACLSRSCAPKSS